MALLTAPKGLSADPPGSRSYLRGSGTVTPDFRKGELKKMKKMMKKRKEEKKRESLSKGIKNSSLVDRVPADLARVVVNMQQYYASGVGELAEKLGSVEEELRRAKEENVMMKKRLDMHFGMLGQTAEFMQRISEGLGGGIMGGEEVGGKEGEEELNQGFGEDADDGDLAMDGVDMEVPPTPADDDRLPMRSTGRMASSRRMVREKSPLQKRKGKEAKRRTAAKVLPIREKMIRPQDNGDADEVDANLESLRLEQSHNGREDNDIADGEDDARVLEGAPRLQEAIRQDALQRAISRDIMRRSRFTPINRMPSRQSTPSSGEDNSDSDEYRPPSSPSAASCFSSFSSSETPPSLYEEEITPSSSTTTDAKPASPPNPQLPTPPPTATLSSSLSSSPRPRYRESRHTTEDRHASGPPGKPFKFHRMGRTVLDVWTEYKIGSKGNPAIEALERQYGTGWRKGGTGGIQDLKYASNYVSVRQKVVRYVEEMCEREGISEREAMRRLDERVDGRMQMLISAVRKGQDPFVVIPKR
ncbi:hypothetical protein TGAM01_v209114 [Trichoderma gamsii]|uniref:Transcription activator GCR1-like domain-containing protein n=1 Tax=Trichoderma gamsii TaxID=398673 RepID=A0A2P4ZCM0_9HYPO|nr:hypothetical protein TGAM01_v209114 [Trichoderma gamsii]PON22044.1 hypothetical protein TGAM01_v209114 [Trichoderma gamsii]